jgi:hypothetical protein
MARSKSHKQWQLNQNLASHEEFIMLSLHFISYLQGWQVFAGSWKNRPGKNSFCRAEKTTRQKPGKISFANICQVEKIDF